MDKWKRYFIFLIGLFINALGVSLITKANLGTSPISSIPYVLSLCFPYTLGEFTIAFSLLLILLQLGILRRNFKMEHFLQIPISILFGYFIDLTMVLLFFIDPSSYLISLFYLFLGCVILGFGVYTEVLADVAMLPGESFVRAVSTTWKTEFGSTKVVFDVSITVIAGLLSFFLTSRLNGIREGTILAALLVGLIARYIGRKLVFIKDYLFPETTTVSCGTDADVSSTWSNVIVIDRQFGSGGHAIGERLAKELGYAFYDNEIIQMSAKSTNYSSSYIETQEENMTNAFLYDLKNQMYGYSGSQTAPQDIVFASEKKIIQDLALQGPCVIVGRCADYILSERPNTMSIFLHAPLSYRQERIVKQEQLSPEDAIKKIHKIDKHRSEYYNYHTNRSWGDALDHDLCLDSSIGEDATISIIKEWMEWKMADHSV